jgi:hypothetical protein
MQQPMMQAQAQPLQENMAQQYEQPQQQIAPQQQMHQQPYQQIAPQQQMMPQQMHQQPYQQIAPQQQMHQQPYQQMRVPRPGWSRSRLTVCGILGIVIATVCITGLIMDASGTPWLWVDDDGGELMDGDDIEDEIVGNGDIPPTFERMASWPSTIFILGIIFAVPLIIIDFVPMPKRLQGGLHGLFLVANGVCSVFIAMSFSEWMGIYIADMLSPSDSMSIHLHVMVYYFAATSLVMLSSLFLFRGRLEVLSAGWSNGHFQIPIATAATNMMFAAIIALVLTPLFPLAWQYYSDDYMEANEPDSNGRPMMPGDIDMKMWQYEGNAVMDDLESEDEPAYDLLVNKARLHNLFLAIFWVQASILLLVMTISIPGIQKIMEGVCQLNILTIGLLIPVIIFTILMYIAIPDLTDEGVLVSSYYDDISYHFNWFLPLAALMGLVAWFNILFRIHIPWWKMISMQNQEKVWSQQGGAMAAAPGQQMMYQQPQMVQQPQQQQGMVQQYQPPQ